jgi:hypothetical protein
VHASDFKQQKNELHHSNAVKPPDLLFLFFYKAPEVVASARRAVVETLQSDDA